MGCPLWGRTESNTTEVTEQQQQQHGGEKKKKKELYENTPMLGKTEA